MIIINNPERVNRVRIPKDCGHVVAPAHPVADSTEGIPQGVEVAFSAFLRDDAGEIITDLNPYTLQILMRDRGNVVKVWNDADITRGADGSLAWIWAQDETATLCPTEYTIEVEVSENGDRRIGGKSNVLKFKYNVISRV